MFYATYSVLTSGLLMFLFPAFWVYTRMTGRYGQHLKERLGFVPVKAVKHLSGSPRIWIHAVSLGELQVASSIIEALRNIIPDSSIIISTFTEHGRKLAKETFGEEIPVVYAPIDFVGSVRKSLSSIRPDIMVFLETEIWPTWLFEARRFGSKTALINGRISVRSIGGYLKLRPFFRKVLSNFDAFSMIQDKDAARIKAMGADPEKIEINGNAKYDLLDSITDPDTETKMRRILNFKKTQQVFVAGSTRDGEEEMVLRAYGLILEKFPETILIIVPRHIDRAPVIGSMVERHGFKYQLRTDLADGKGKRTEQVVIINTFNELFDIYSIGTIVFCGASLVPLGGQNPLEPAIWGKAVLHGPSMEDFSDAKTLLEEAGASVGVTNPEVLAERVIWFFGHPDELKKCGERGREAVKKNQGSAVKHAKVIKRLLFEEDYSSSPA